MVYRDDFGLFVNILPLGWICVDTGILMFDICIYM